MYLEQNVLEMLNKDRIRNINLINFIREYSIDSINIEGNSILVKGKSDQEWTYISSQSQKELKSLLDILNNNNQYFAVLEDWMLPMIIKNKEVIWKLSCVKLYFSEHVVLPENKYKVLELSPLEAPYIYENSEYKEYTSTEYIIERINKGIGLGLYEDDQLVAWIITHDDGAMGFLNVLPNYRRNGYTYELTIAMIKRLRSIGEVAFVHIEEDNIKSISLALKIGFIKDRIVHWLKIGK